MLIHSRSRAHWVALSLLVVAVGSHGIGLADEPSQSNDIFGESPTAIDTEKAQLAFVDLTPPIEIKRDDSSVETPLSDRVKRALDRAATLRDDERFTEAMIELEKAQRIADQGDRRIHRELALTAWLSGDQQRARTHIKSVLDSGEDDITCHYILGRLAASRFESETATVEYRKALQCSTVEGTEYFKRLATLELFEALLAGGYVSAALDLHKTMDEAADATGAESSQFPRWAQKAIRAYPPMAERAAWAHARLGDYEQAANMLRKAYDKSSPPEDQVLNYAKLLARAGDMDGAIDQARRALATQPEAIDVLMAIYKHQDRPDAIVEEFESAIQSGDASPKVAMAYAQALIKFDRRDEAVRLIEEQLANSPSSRETIQAAVEVLLAAESWNSAVDVCGDAVRKHPELATDVVGWIQAHAAAHPDSDLAKLADVETKDDFASAFVKGNIALAFDLEEPGRAWLERSLDDRPSFIAARVGLARIHLNRWQWEEAIEIATPEKFKLDRDSQLEMIAGEAYRGLDDRTNAIGHFEAAVRLHRGNINAMLALAELYSASGNSTAARRQLERIIRIDAFNEKARTQLCLNHLGNGDRRAAAEQIQKLRIHRASPTRVAQCVAALEFDARSPDYDRFRKTLQEAIDVSVPDAETLQLIAMSYMQQSNWDEAIKAVESALELNPNHLESISMLMDCRQRNLEFDKALALQETLLKRHPQRQLWKQNRLELLLTTQQYDEAIEYAQLLVADPGVSRAFVAQVRFEVITAYRTLNRNTEALKEMEKWRHKESDNPVILRYVIRACQDFGKHERAMELIRRWNTDIPGGYGRGELTDIWQNLLPEQRSQVLELLVDAIAVNPQDDQLHTCLIAFLRETKQYDDALALASNSAVDGVFKELFLHELYLTFQASGRIDDAIGVIEDMMAVNADEAANNPEMNRFLQRLLVDVLINAGRANDAVDQLNGWLKQARDAGLRESEFYYLGLLSIAHQESGDLDGARQALETYLKLDPVNVGLHNDLGYTLADAGVELDRAEKMIRVAVGESPRNSAYLDSLGWVLYKKGKFEESKHWLELARGGPDGEDPVIYEHLGDTLWRLGEKEAAIQSWKDGLEIARKRIKNPPASAGDRRAAEKAEARISAAEGGLEPELAVVVGDSGRNVVQKTGVVEESNSE